MLRLFIFVLSASFLHAGYEMPANFFVEGLVIENPSLSVHVGKIGQALISVIETEDNDGLFYSFRVDVAKLNPSKDELSKLDPVLRGDLGLNHSSCFTNKMQLQEKLISNLEFTDAEPGERLIRHLHVALQEIRACALIEQQLWITRTL